jgi:dipicolinate synthase subunit B
MDYKAIDVGLVVTGSFCTFNQMEGYISELADGFGSVTPILSETAATLDTKFNTFTERRGVLELITGNRAITAITEAEVIGPSKLFDVVVVAPCTGNTLAKLANGITDTAATMAVKAHLRNNAPVVVGVSSNDILGQNARNLGVLLNTRNYYFIPFYQDDPVGKEKSVTFNCGLMMDTVKMALNGRQIQPLLLSK